MELDEICIDVLKFVEDILARDTLLDEMAASYAAEDELEELALT